MADHPRISAARDLPPLGEVMKMTVRLAWLGHAPFVTGLFITGLLVVLLLGTAAETQNWTVDPESSRISFTFQERGRTVDGILGYFDAVIAFDPSQLDLSNAEVSVPVSAIDAGAPERNELLLGPLWFDQANHPNVLYKVDNFVQDKSGAFLAYGNLTIREIVHPVALTFSLKIKNKKAHMTGSTAISRKDFSLGTGEWANENIVGDHVEIRVEMQASRSDE